MTDAPSAAIQAAAEVMLRQYESQYEAGHLTWEDFASDAQAVIAAALPAFRERVQQARSLSYEQACDLTDKGKAVPAEHHFGRLGMCDEVLRWLAPEGADEGSGGSRTYIHWAVAYGCPSGNPEEGANILPYDDEENARENLDWAEGSFVVRRTVTAGCWERVDPGTPPAGEEGQ